MGPLYSVSGGLPERGRVARRGRRIRRPALASREAVAPASGAESDLDTAEGFRYNPS